MIKTYTHFLKRSSVYDDEKPYSLRFAPPAGFPRSNISLERHEIQIRDIRCDKNEYSFKQDGFEVVELNTSLGYEDFDDESRVKKVYLQEVADMLRRHLGAMHVQIFEHTVRKRHEIFPISTGEAYRYNQPTSIAHVGTYAGVRDSALGGPGADYRCGHDVAVGASNGKKTEPDK